MALTTRPGHIIVCNLEVIVMPNGEIICDGHTVGWFERFAPFLTKKK